MVPPEVKTTGEVLLRTRALTKKYPGVLALSEVDFDLRKGEVHVLFGENGAGKSTLICLLAGVSSPTSGDIEINGQPVQLRSVRDARLRGISAVFQEFSLVPTLTVTENLLLGAEPGTLSWLPHKARRAAAKNLLASLDFQLDPDRLVQTLSRAQRQMVEIVKSLRSDISVLILDEPTASLTEHETASLFKTIGLLRARGIGIIYISHRMQELKQIADRITVLRDGKKVATLNADQTDEANLVRLMAGRSIEQIYPAIEHRPGEVVLEIKDLHTRGGISGANLTVRRGEILGLAGLVGQGKSVLMRAAFGLDTCTAGRIIFKGEDVTGMSPRALIAKGMFYMPSDRKTEGLVLNFDGRRNMTLGAFGRSVRNRLGVIGKTPRQRLTAKIAKQVELAPANLPRAVTLLSGGNQQKVLFGKGLAIDADLYIFDEPTVGVDVMTRTALYRLIKHLAESGAAVVIISSDLPEVLHMAHRIVVVSAGQAAAEFSDAQISEDAVIGAFFRDTNTALQHGPQTQPDSQLMH